MKKTVRILLLILSLALAALCFAGCSDHGAPEHSTANPLYAVTTAELQDELNDFLTNNPDRTTFKQYEINTADNTLKTAGEKKAAEYIFDRLDSFGYAPEYDNMIVEEKDHKDLKSQNVVATYAAKNHTDATKSVVIGAYYDNRYYKSYSDSDSTGAEGALSNGTGVAALLSIAKYLKSRSEPFDFDVNIVFFGASCVYNTGVNSYFDSLSALERKNIVLMIELQRLGGDHVYAFSDARETKREPLFESVAKQNRLDIYKVTAKSPLICELSVLDGIPYYQWAHNGNFSTFFSAGIPTLNLVGANWETIRMSDIEAEGYGRISGTSSDTLKNLRELCPDYAEKMAIAATLVVRSLEHPDFLSTMTSDRENFPDTSVLTKRWVWELIVFGFCAIGGIIMLLLANRLGKKYPPVAPQRKHVKMAVFGMDYEDKNPDSIYVDIKPAAPVGDIFDEVPNNESRHDIIKEILGTSVVISDGADASPFDEVPENKKSDGPGDTEPAENAADDAADPPPDDPFDTPG